MIMVYQHVVQCCLISAAFGQDCRLLTFIYAGLDMYGSHLKLNLNDRAEALGAHNPTRQSTSGSLLGGKGFPKTSSNFKPQKSPPRNRRLAASSGPKLRSTGQQPNSFRLRSVLHAQILKLGGQLLAEVSKQPPLRLILRLQTQSVAHVSGDWGFGSGSGKDPRTVFTLPHLKSGGG